jgi:hypothetical protein
MQSAPRRGHEMTGTDRQVSGIHESTKRHHSKKQITGCIRGIACAAALASALAPQARAVSTCKADSPAQRVALLELYTSEGCSSCPPADRFLRALAARGFDAGKVVALAFHVDYWDSLGWRDRFARPAFSARQRMAADRARARFVYTPQFLLDGRDLDGGWMSGDFAARVAAINRQPASASVSITQRLQGDVLQVAVTAIAAAGTATDLFIAILESGLTTAVRAGENSGRLLEHDHVVRVLEGPLPPATRSVTIRLSPEWGRTRLDVAAFLQARASGEVLQVLAGPLCPS